MGALESSTVTFTTEQEAVLAHKGEPAFVLAGPGSGKTTVLTERIKRILDADASARVLGLTFSKKAAQDMLRKLDGFTDRAQVQTFHAFALDVLKTAGGTAQVDDDVPAVRAGLEADYEAAIGQAKTAHAMEAPLHTIDRFVNFLPAYKRRLERYPLTADQWIGSFPDMDAQATAFYASFIDAFIHERLQRGAFMLDELVPYALNRILADERTRQAMINRFTEVLVDELQDTNQIQWLLAKSLSDWSALVAFGDPRQAIYGFRGGNRENALRFREWFPDAVEYPLTINHRARRTLVAFANDVLGCMNESRIRPSDAAEDGNPVWHVEVTPDGAAKHHARRQDYMDAIQTACFDVINRIMTHGAKPMDVLVMARGNEMIGGIADLLDGLDIPFQVLSPECPWNQTSLRLTTVHGAKGLEAPIAILAGADSRGFSTYQLSKEEQGELQRTFFVGVTRAMKELILVKGRGHGLGAPFGFHLPSTTALPQSLPDSFSA